MSWFLRPLVFGAEKIFKDFLKKLLGDFVELHNFKLEPLQGGFTGTLEGLQLKVAAINTLIGDVPLTLESGIIAKASVEISVKRECRLHLDGVELHFLVGADAMVRIKQQATVEDLTRSTTEGKYFRGFESETDDDDDDDESENEYGEGTGRDRPAVRAKETMTFTVLKEKIKEILRRVERVEVSNVHILLSTKEGKGKQELHLHINHLRYEDATQPEAAQPPVRMPPPKRAVDDRRDSVDGATEEDDIKIESSTVVKSLEIEGIKVMVEEFHKHPQGNEDMLEIVPTKLLEIAAVPQRNYSRDGDADDDDENNSKQKDDGEAGKSRRQKSPSGRMLIGLTVGQTVVVESIDMAFDHHRIDVIVPPKYLKFVLDLAERFNAHTGDSTNAATTTTAPQNDKDDDNADGRTALTSKGGLSVPVYAFPKCTLHVNRGSVILLEEDPPTRDERHAAGPSIKMDMSQSSEREMFTANRSSAMIVDSVSQLEFMPFERVPRFSCSFERASIAISSRMLPPPPPQIPSTLPSPLASGYYSPHSSLTPSPAAPFLQPRAPSPLPPRVPPPSSALLVEIRMRDCDLVEFVHERRAREDDVDEDEDDDSSDESRLNEQREVRFDLIRLGVKEDEDEEEDDDEEDDHVNDVGRDDDAEDGGDDGASTLVGDERFLIRFEKKVRIEEREMEMNLPQQSFDDIDAEEMAGIGVPSVPPPPPFSSRTNSGIDVFHDRHLRSDTPGAKDNSELMIWEESKLLIETARLNVETDTKIAERIERLIGRLLSTTPAPAAEPTPKPEVQSPTSLEELLRRKEEERAREEHAANAHRPFENWSIQRNFFIDIGARKKLRANIHFYDAHGRRKKEKLDVLLFDTSKIRFSTCLSSFDSSDQGLCAAFQDATVLEFDFENIMATITSSLGFPKAPFFRASMADTRGDRVTPLEITFKPPTSLQVQLAAHYCTNDDNVVGDMTALVSKKGHTFSQSEVERMNHFKYLTSQLSGVAIKIRFPFSEIELEKHDYDAIMAILDNLSPPSPAAATLPPDSSSSAAALPPLSSPSHARGGATSYSPSPTRGVPTEGNKAAKYRLDASTIVEVTLTHANLKLLESRGKGEASAAAASAARTTKQPAHKPFHLHFVDVERLSIFFAAAQFNEKASNWLLVDADNFLLYERLMSAQRSSVYTPATLVVNRNPFVNKATAARPVFSSLFLLPGSDHGMQNRMDFNDLIIHHRAGFQWYNHLGTFFSGEAADGETSSGAEAKPETLADVAAGEENGGANACGSVTQLYINLPNLELEYTPTLVPGNAFITTGYLQVDLLIFGGRKEPKRMADIPRLELNVVAKPRKANAGRNIAIYIAKSAGMDDQRQDASAADSDENEMARQKRLHWRSNSKRYLKAGVLNSAFSVRFKSRLVDEELFLRLLQPCSGGGASSTSGAQENEGDGESDNVAAVDLRRFCDDASMQHGFGTAGRRHRKRTVGRWMTKLTLCQYDVNDDKSKAEDSVRPFLFGFCPDSLSTFVDIFNEALLPADLVLADIDPDAQAKREEMAQQQRLRKERQEKRQAALKRKQQEELLRRKAGAKGERMPRSVSGAELSSREGTAELVRSASSSSGISSREGSLGEGLEASRIREGLPPDIAEKIRKQDEIRIEEARKRDRGRRSRSSSLTGNNGDAEKKIHVSDARLQNGIWYMDPRKMKIVPDYWHTPGDSRLLPSPTSIASFCVTVKSGLSINLRLYGGLDWPSLALAAPKETIVERQLESFFEVRLTGLKLRFDEFLRQPLFPRRLALAVHDVTVVDNVGPAPRDKVDLFAHNKKKDRLAETAMLYFTLTCHKKGDKSQTQGGEGNAEGRDDDDDELGINPDEEYWEGALEMPAPLRIKVHENVLKLLVFSHHPFFPLATTELPATPPMLICGFRVGPLVAKIDWSGWSYSDELLAALTPENLGGLIVDRNTLVGYGVFLGGYKALTAISLRWGERQFPGLYYGWGELMGKIVELYAIDVARKPHKVIGAVGGIRHVKEAVRLGSEAIVANLPALPVSMPLPDVSTIGEYINTETIGSALGYASSVTSYLSTYALSSSSSFMSSVYSQAQHALNGAEDATAAPRLIGPGAPKGDSGRAPAKRGSAVKGKERVQREESDEEDDDAEEEVKIRVFGEDEREGRPSAHSYEDDEEDDDYVSDDSYDESDRATTERNRMERERKEAAKTEAEAERRRKEKARREREEREREEQAERLRRQERAKRESERTRAAGSSSSSSSRAAPQAKPKAEPTRTKPTTKTNKSPTKTKTTPSYSDNGSGSGSDDDFSMEWKD